MLADILANRTVLLLKPVLQLSITQFARTVPLLTWHRIRKGTASLRLLNLGRRKLLVITGY